MFKLALLFLGVVACSTPSSAPDATSDPVPLTGQTGALTVATANTVVNQYGVLGANVAAGATSLTITSAADFTATAPFTTALAAGDLLMIYQPQGATIDATDTAAYGNVTVLGTAGRYELVHVASVAGTTIALETSCGGLKSAYTTAGATEVIRVPQLTTLTISGAGSITARAWDGARGGVVAIQAQTTATLGGGGIDVTGKGFRGGAADDVTTGPPGTTTIRSATNATGGEKGESIAGFQAAYDTTFNGRFGRGAPANGGGGGDAHNGGGGGGGNGNNGSVWTGAGVMLNAVTGAAAWTLDPDYVLNGNAPTTSSGGGRGGYTFSGADQNALTVAPGNASWGGDARRDVGGLGGRPLANDPSTRLFLGGGGGAGDGNNTAAGPGGPGGGLVLLLAPTVTGTAAIVANGAVGVDSMHNPGDAPGGGGAGGTVVVAATALSGIAIHANGGVGGNQTLQANLEAEGPGGGGGGGFVAVSGGAIAATATGALGGLTNAPTLAEFPANGATSGATGVANAVVTAINACTTDDLQLTNTDGKATIVAGTANTYTLVVTNAGADVVAGATVTETFPAALTGVTWTCVASAGGSCPASGSGNLGAAVTVAPGGTVTFTITGTVDPSATGTLAVTASVTAPAGVTDPTPGNNTATDTDQITVSADLSVAITDAPDPVAPGGTETYTVTVTDLGPSTATGITVTETLPAGATFVSATGTGWTCTQAAGIVTCTRPSLPPGAAPPIAIVVTVPNAPGTITDTATVGSTSTDPTPGNNSATQSTTVAMVGPATADLAIALTDAPDPVAAGGTLTYTATVTNLGPNPATGVTVTDTLPAGATFVSATGTGWTCTVAGTTVTCTAPTLAAGAAPAIAIVVTAPALVGTLTSTATVAATSTDPVPGNNTATQMTTVGPSADLAIAITDAPDPVALGGTLTYSVAVTDLGPSAATNLTVTDTLPPTATFVSATGTGWTCVQAGVTVTCTRPALAVGAAPPIAIVVTAPNVAGAIVDAATVTATSTDPVAGNNSAMQTTTVGIAGSADLAIALTDAPDPVAPGGTLTYTATVTNLGPSSATSVTVVDALPAGTAFVSATGTGWACALAGTTVTCTRPLLAVGAAPAIAIVVTAPVVIGTITDTVTVAATSPDPVPGNNTATQATTVGPFADLAIAIVGTPDPVPAGGTETFTVTVTNSGPSTATGVTVTETLPPGSPFVSVTGTGWSCTQAAGVVTCTTPSIPPGGAPPITIVVTMPTTPGVVTTTAGVTATTADPAPGNNTASTATTVGASGSADLAIALTAQPDPVAPGGALTYAVAVTDLGPDSAANVVVTDTLPAGVTFTGATGTGWTCTAAGQVVTCTRPILGAGAAPAIAITATAPATSGAITDTATVAATTPDPVSPNNSASVTSQVGLGTSADLAIAITDDGPVVAHHTLTFSVTVANLGPDAPADLVVRTMLPSDATAVTASNDWTCTTTPQVVTCRAATMTTAPIEIQVTAPGTGTTSATATVSNATADPVTGNNTATDTVDVTPNLTVRGGGCDAGGGSTGALVLLAVVGLVLRRRRLAVVVAGALALPAVAAAQSADSFPVERMRVAIDRDGVLGVEWAGAPARWAWNLGTWIGYADDPLVLADRDTGDRVASLVHRRLGGGLFGAVGLTSWLEVGLEMPLIYAQDASGSTMGALASPKLGDLRFAPKLVLRQGADRLGVALMVGFTVPSSGSSAYAGDRGATFDPELILSRAWGGFRLAGNVGYLARKTETLMDLTVDDELYARIGAGYRFASRPLEIDATTGISTAAAKPFAQINTDPWEVDLAAQYDVRRDVTLFALGGMGIGAGFGAPDYRVVVGLRFTRTPPVGPRDTDGDGIIDELDKCPTEPEDRDGFEDADGCPDPDNDKDGIPDVADKCPNEPEDKDGFEDADGCPDPDNDKDGIPDTEDKCPNEPEDKDGFEDTDGCPDPDNDKDGILDAEDRCPNEPGPASNQGCPDPDRDGDGVPDRIDNCPDEPGPVENHGCAKKQLVTITNGKLELVDRVYFRTDKDIIETRSNAILDNVAKVLLAHPEIAKVRVEGHTDNRGGAKHNQDLSQRRAAAVVKYLVGKKVARDRLDPAGFGQDRPIADNDSDTGRATNRRVEFVIVGDGVETKATGPDAGTIGK